MSRDSQTDNRKHGPATTKAASAVQMTAYPSKGAWEAPGQATVPVSSEENDEYQAGQCSTYMEEPD